MNEHNINYANSIVEKLSKKKIRVERDFSNESVGKKIRSAVIEKSPFILVLGDKEMNENLISVRKRGSKDTVSCTYEEFENMLLQEIAHKAL